MKLVNVRLPSFSSNQLFQLKIENGRYELIQMQTGPVVTPVPKLSELPTDLIAETKEIDVEGRVLLPSFVDVHTHLDKAYSLPAVPNRSGTLVEAIENYSAKAATFTPDEIKERVRRAAIQSLHHGTAYIRTHVNFELDVSEELALSNLQAVLEVRDELSPMMSLQVVPMFSKLSTRTKRELEVIEEAISYGVDGIGGAPHLSTEANADLDVLFELAGKKNKWLDLHVDEQDNPEVRTISYIIDKTRELGYQGKVFAGHLCSLSAMDEQTAFAIIEGMRQEKIGAITLPGANLYLQGREDKGIVRRGITRVRDLLAAGVSVAAASDNVHDPFHPFGRCDLLQIGLLTSYTAHLAEEKEIQEVLKMITEVPAAFFGLENYGVKEGADASFTILDADNLYDGFARLSPTRYLYHQGQWTSVMRSESQLLRSEKPQLRV